MENKCCAAYDYESAIKAVSGVSGYTPMEIDPDREELERLKRSHDRYEKYTGAVINALGYIIDSDREQIKLLERNNDCASQSRERAIRRMQEVAEELETAVDKNRDLEAKLKAALEREEKLKADNNSLLRENLALRNDKEVAVKALKAVGAEIPITSYRQTVMVATEDLKKNTEVKKDE